MTTPLDAELPQLPEPDGYLEINLIGRSIAVDGYRSSTVRAAQREAFEAGVRAARQPAPPPAAQAQQRSLPLEFDDELGVFLWKGRPTLDTLEDSQDVLAELDKARGFANGYRVMAEMLLPQPPQGGSV